MRREHMAHRYWHLPVTALEALYARERGALEVILKRSRYGIGLLRRQKTKLKLRLIFNKITSFCLCIFANFHIYYISVHNSAIL